MTHVARTRWGIVCVCALLWFVPAAARASTIAAGDGHTVVVTPDGTVWTWGRNNEGQLGDGTQLDRHAPGPVPGLTDVIAVSAGHCFTLALKSDGTVWAWGGNYRNSQFRIVGITDALGQVTTLSYEHPSDPLKITKVTDPFGRFATFTYTATGHLASITDVIGLTSSFHYAFDGFLDRLTTPYGTTTFRKETNSPYAAYIRHIEAVDPLGGTERVEYHTSGAVPVEAPAADVPTGFENHNAYMDLFVSLYWSKRAMMLAPGDRQAAVVTSWLAENNFDRQWLAVSVPKYIKRPLEGRIWYAYPGQTLGTGEPGAYVRPTQVARVLDDGTSQIWQTTYNDRGMVTSQTDPTGRRTSYAYDANGIDLLTVRQTTGALNDLIATQSNYTSQHLPQSITDAAGQTTAFAYNPHGQILTLTNARNETRTYEYDGGSEGYLRLVTGPMTGSTKTLTYDSYGRVRTVTESDGYTIQVNYDGLDRVTKLTSPDSSYDEYTYDKLDLVELRDRLGRTTKLFVDQQRRLVAVRDPLGRTIAQQWCICGTLDAVIDANGSRTRWERDLQGRTIREVKPDGTTETLFTYESTITRLKQSVDSRGQKTIITYELDNRPREVTHMEAVIPTPSVAYGYDANYPRLVTRVDGTGTTAYTYKAPGTLGAGRLAGVDGRFCE